MPVFAADAGGTVSGSVNVVDDDGRRCQLSNTGRVVPLPRQTTAGRNRDGPCRVAVTFTRWHVRRTLTPRRDPAADFRPYAIGWKFVIAKRYFIVGIAHFKREIALHGGITFSVLPSAVSQFCLTPTFGTNRAAAISLKLSKVRAL